MRRIGIIGAALFAGAGLALFLVVYLSTYQPAALEPTPVVCQADAPELQPGQKLRVLNWNVQYMAGKGFVFWYETDSGEGAERPTPEAVEATLGDVAGIIQREDPDVILLQEMQNGAAQTFQMDLLAELLQLLPELYPCYARAYYWKAAFVPHPRVMGSTGMELVTLSRYRIASAERRQLPLMPGSWMEQQFNLKRAMLETRLPIAETDAGELAVINTHLDAFAQGSDTMKRQAAAVRRRLDQLEEEGTPWIAAGDFNLLPPGFARERVHPASHDSYNETSELGVVFEAHQSAAPLEELLAPDAARHFTYFSNRPEILAPDRTIDYIFFGGGLKLNDFRVLQGETLEISDHLPLRAEFALPAAP